MVSLTNWLFFTLSWLFIYIWIDELNVRNDQMDDNNFQSSLCITSMKQKPSWPIEAHGPFILVIANEEDDSKFVYVPSLPLSITEDDMWEMFPTARRIHLIDAEERKYDILNNIIDDAMIFDFFCKRLHSPQLYEPFYISHTITCYIGAQFNNVFPAMAISHKAPPVQLRLDYWIDRNSWLKWSCMDFNFVTSRSSVGIVLFMKHTRKHVFYYRFSKLRLQRHISCLLR